MGVKSAVAAGSPLARLAICLIKNGVILMQKRAVMVVSQVAELGMFFAAAAALAVGLLGLR